jgi:hypothetical protein
MMATSCSVAGLMIAPGIWTPSLDHRSNSNLNFSSEASLWISVPEETSPVNEARKEDNDMIDRE